MAEAARERSADCDAAELPAVRRLQEIATRGLPFGSEQPSEVVVVASSSRGGSSLVAEALRGFSELLSLQGELTPLLRAGGIDRHRSPSDSDELVTCTADEADAAVTQIAFDACGERGSLADMITRELFVDRLHWRLTAQWPLLEVRRDAVRYAVLTALSETRHGPNSGSWSLEQLRDFHTEVLVRLAAVYPDIDLRYYDLTMTSSRRESWNGPPSSIVLEEPPFVTVWPCRPLARDELSRKALVIKSPSNSYRLSLIRQLFPRARLRVLHITRHPRSSVAGLVNGWLHSGFYAHRLGGGLRMSGYCDVVGDEERNWWKFDLPPGWRAWTARHLVDVARFQWESAHRAVLDGYERVSDDYLRVRVEDLLTPHRDAGRSVHRLGKWLGLSQPGVIASRIRALPLVMATPPAREPPARAHARLIEAVLEERAVRELSRCFGYEDD